ncbi:MAG: glycosyltransferase [Bacteroidota bacterium]|nr:glycosyltransferase [Bacteroidota bacterium]
MKIFALVITYNRSKSLEKAMKRLLSQKRKADEIVIINNCSTDNTSELLKNYQNDAHIFNLNQNTGGAGAYYFGLNQCVKMGADWIIGVEDDIILPKNHILHIEQTIKSQNFSEIGFIYPKVISIHDRYKLDGFLYYKNQITTEYPRLLKAQFAGLSFNANAIKKVGLPIHSFFIYYDDWEYTERMNRHGFEGIHTPNLYVWHNDVKRSDGSPYLHAPYNGIWKSYYGIRNELTYLKNHHFKTYCFQLMKHVFWIPLITLLKRKDHAANVAFNWAFWSFKSIFKTLQIDYVNDSNTKAFEKRFLGK